MSGQPVSYATPAGLVALPVELLSGGSYTGRAEKQAVALPVELNFGVSSTKTQAVELSSSTKIPAVELRNRSI